MAKREEYESRTEQYLLPLMEKHGFELTSQTKACNGITEVMYRKKL